MSLTLNTILYNGYQNINPQDVRGISISGAEENSDLRNSGCSLATNHKTQSHFCQRVAQSQVIHQTLKAGSLQSVDDKQTIEALEKAKRAVAGGTYARFSTQIASQILPKYREIEQLAPLDELVRQMKYSYPRSTVWAAFRCSWKVPQGALSYIQQRLAPHHQYRKLQQALTLCIQFLNELRQEFEEVKKRMQEDVNVVLIEFRSHLNTLGFPDEEKNRIYQVFQEKLHQFYNKIIQDLSKDVEKIPRYLLGLGKYKNPSDFDPSTYIASLSVNHTNRKYLATPNVQLRKNNSNRTPIDIHSSWKELTLEKNFRKFYLPTRAFKILPDLGKLDELEFSYEFWDSNNNEWEKIKDGHYSDFNVEFKVVEKELWAINNLNSTNIKLNGLQLRAVIKNLKTKISNITETVTVTVSNEFRAPLHIEGYDLRPDGRIDLKNPSRRSLPLSDGAMDFTYRTKSYTSKKENNASQQPSTLPNLSRQITDPKDMLPVVRVLAGKANSTGFFVGMRKEAPRFILTARHAILADTGEDLTQPIRCFAPQIDNQQPGHELKIKTVWMPVDPPGPRKYPFYLTDIAIIELEKSYEEKREGFNGGSFALEWTPDKDGYDKIPARIVGYPGTDATAWSASGEIDIYDYHTPNTFDTNIDIRSGSSGGPCYRTGDDGEPIVVGIKINSVIIMGYFQYSTCLRITEPLFEVITALMKGSTTSTESKFSIKN